MPEIMQFSISRRTFAVLVTALVLISVMTVAPASADGRRMEEIAMGWVEAHNSGQVAQMAAYRAEHRRNAGSGWEDQFASLVERLGILEVVDVMIEHEDEIVLGIESAERGRVHMTFVFDESDPEQISSVQMGTGEAHPNSLPPLELSGDWGTRTKAVDAYLTKLANDGVFSGAVLIADGEELRFSHAYGMASREFEVPNTLATRFDIGSITKDFTRVAIAQLIVAGKLSADDTVGKHLPDYPNPEVREKVTVRHLFEHTSGIGDYFTDEWLETPMGALREHDDYITIWGSKPLQFEPGSRSEYSNFGFTVLGAIIDKVSGQPYFEYVSEHVFAAAGMTSSGFFATDEAIPNVAVGYTYMDRDEERGETLRKNTYLEPVVGGPWGKTYSTAEDLWRFWLGVSRHRLTDAAYTPWVLLSGPLPDPGAAAEPGAGAERGEPVLSIGLGGGGPGLSAELSASNDRIFVVLANLDPPITRHLSQRLSEALAGR